MWALGQFWMGLMGLYMGWMWVWQSIEVLTVITKSNCNDYRDSLLLLLAIVCRLPLMVNCTIVSFLLLVIQKIDIL